MINLLAIRALFPPTCATRTQSTLGDLRSLTPREMLAVKYAVPTRQREFAAGRTAAKCALNALGDFSTEIPIVEKPEI